MNQDQVIFHCRIKNIVGFKKTMESLAPNLILMTWKISHKGIEIIHLYPSQRAFIYAFFEKKNFELWELGLPYTTTATEREISEGGRREEKQQIKYRDIQDIKTVFEIPCSTEEEIEELKKEQEKRRRRRGRGIEKEKEEGEHEEEHEEELEEMGGSTLLSKNKEYCICLSFYTNRITQALKPANDKNVIDIYHYKDKPEQMNIVISDKNSTFNTRVNEIELVFNDNIELMTPPISLNMQCYIKIHSKTLHSTIHNLHTDSKDVRIEFLKDTIIIFCESEGLKTTNILSSLPQGTASLPTITNTIVSSSSSSSSASASSSSSINNNNNHNDNNHKQIKQIEEVEVEVEERQLGDNNNNDNKHVDVNFSEQQHERFKHLQYFHHHHHRNESDGNDNDNDETTNKIKEEKKEEKEEEKFHYSNYYKKEFIELFTKANSLNIYTELGVNDDVLSIRYNIQNLGFVLFLISPLSEEERKVYEEDGEGNDYDCNNCEEEEEGKKNKKEQVNNNENGDKKNNLLKTANTTTTTTTDNDNKNMNNKKRKKQSQPQSQPQSLRKKTTTKKNIDQEKNDKKKNKKIKKHHQQQEEEKNNNNNNNKHSFNNHDVFFPLTMEEEDDDDDNGSNEEEEDDDDNDIE